MIAAEKGELAAHFDATSELLFWHYKYGPFGEVIRATGPMAKANPFRFSTKYQDDESDIVMYPRRPYNPSTGRFLCKDPIEEKGGLNLYSMVGNNPINQIDPLGLNWWSDAWNDLEGWADALGDLGVWVAGHPQNTDYGPDSLQSQQMSQSSIAGQFRAGYKNKFNGKPCKDWGSYTDVKSNFGAKQVVVDGLNGTAEFVGDARGDVNATSVDCAKGKVTVKFKLTNTTSLTSIFYGVYPNSWNPTTGPVANWTQTYTWYEKFDCKCCP